MGVHLQVEVVKGVYRYTGSMSNFFVYRGMLRNILGRIKLGIACRGAAEKYSGGI